MATFFQQLVNGLSIGAIYALIALGYTMVYGVLKLINFAHSEVFMMGAYFGLIALALLMGQPGLVDGMLVPLTGAASHGFLGAHPVVATAIATILAMLAAAGLGVVVERLAYRPLRKRGKGALARPEPLVNSISAVSVGVIEGEPRLDLMYTEDVRAETDMNVVVTGSGEFVEVQGTAEGTPFRRDELDALLDLAVAGCAQLADIQHQALAAG